MRDTNVIALPIAQRGSSLLVWLYRALLAVLCSLALVDPAWCQATKSKDKTPSTKAATKAASGAMTANPDSETLPADYVPPKEKDPLFDLDMPIALPDELVRLKNEDVKFQPVLNKALSDEASKTVIRNGIRYRLAQMCQAENFKTENLHKLYDMRVKLRSYLNNAGSAAKDLKPNDLRNFRLFVMQEFVKQATPLLENNLYVRVQIVFLMGELELVQENTQKAVSVEAFTPVLDPLVKAILDPKQPESVKLVAVNALARVLKIGTPNVNERTRIAEAMIAELAKPNTHWWYQMRLAGALGTAVLDQGKQPIVVTALKGVVNDPKREWSVRTEAAMALGRVPLTPASDPSSVVRAIAELTLQLAKAAQQKPGDLKWKTEFWKVYLAFRPLNEKDKDAAKKEKAGLLNNVLAAGVAKPPYDLIVPMVSAMRNGERLTAAQIAALEAWVKDNTPAGAAPKPVPAVPKE